MTFDTFIAHRNATGRDALEAYDNIAFNQMTAKERHRAEIMLADDLNAGRLRACRGLALLGGDRAIKTLKAALMQAHVPGKAHVALCDALYLATVDESYQRLLLDDLTCEQPELARDVVMVLASSTPTLAVQEGLVQAIGQHELDEATRALAVSALMVCFGFPALSDDMSPERLHCERALMAATPSTWDHVIEEIRLLAQQRGYAAPRTED